VFNEAAAARVVVLASCCGALKADAVFFYEELAKSVEAWVGDFASELDDGAPISFLLGASFRIASEEVGCFTLCEWAKVPALGVESVLILSPITSESEEIFGGKFLCKFELRKVFPDLEGELVNGVSEDEFEIGFS
jgi:hypothetical protein